MEEDSHHPVEKRLSSAVSCASSSTSGFEAGSKAQVQDDGWKEEGVHPHLPCVSLAIWCVQEICFTYFLVFFDILEVHISVGSTTEAPDSDQMFKLADLLEGVSVDCTDLSRTQLPSN